MRLKLVDDYGDFGFGGKWAIAVVDDDDDYDYDYGEYLCDGLSDPVEVAAAAAAKPFAAGDSRQAYVFKNKKLASQALSAARKAMKSRSSP